MKWVATPISCQMNDVTNLDWRFARCWRICRERCTINNNLKYSITILYIWNFRKFITALFGKSVLHSFPLPRYKLINGTNAKSTSLTILSHLSAYHLIRNGTLWKFSNRPVFAGEVCIREVKTSVIMWRERIWLTLANTKEFLILKEGLVYWRYVYRVAF